MYKMPSYKIQFQHITTYLVNGWRTNEKEKMRSLVRMEFNFLAGNEEAVMFFDNLNLALVLLCN